MSDIDWLALLFLGLGFSLIPLDRWLEHRRIMRQARWQAHPVKRRG